MTSFYLPIRSKNEKFKGSKKMIELSVILPMFRAKYCAWIALESLVRQEGIDFDWELIIAEEINNNEVFGKAALLKEYKSRLVKIRCKKIKYFPLEKHMPLSNKYAFMGRKCAPTSYICVSNSADLYAPPKRLKMQRDLFKKNPNIDIAMMSRCIVYDIQSGKTYLNDRDLNPNKRIDDGVCRALRTKIMRNLPTASSKKGGVDGWIFDFCHTYNKLIGKAKTNVYVDRKSDNWKYCLNVNGLNTITKIRRKYMLEVEKRPINIIDCPINLSKTIPKEILQRLKDAKKLLKHHNSRRM